MSVRKSIAWAGAGQVRFFVLQFGGSVVLARLLTPYEMGVYAVAAAVIGVLSTIQAFGLTGLIVREEEMHPDLLISIFTINTLMAVILSGLIFAAGFFTAGVFDEPGVRRVLSVLALIPLVGAFEFRPSGMLQRESKFHLLTMATTTRMVIATGITVLLAFRGFSYMSNAWGQLIGSAVGVAFFNVVGRRHVSVRLGLREWRKVTHFGVQMLAIAGVNTLSTRAADVVLGKVLGLASLGLYSRASNLYNLMWDNLHQVISKVAFADMAEQRRRGLPLRPWYLRAIEMMTAVLWPAFIGLAILAGPVIYTIYGVKWVAAAGPLSLLCVAGAVLVAMAMAWEVFVICKETGRQARFEAVRTAVGLSVFCTGAVLGGPIYGLLTAAAARILEAIFTITLYRAHVERMTGTRWADYVPIYSRSLLLTAVAVGPAGVTMLVFHGAYTAPLPWVALSVLAGVGLWAASLRVMRHPLIREFEVVLGSAGKRLRLGAA